MLKTLFSYISRDTNMKNFTILIAVCLLCSVANVFAINGKKHSLRNNQVQEDLRNLKGFWQQDGYGSLLVVGDSTIKEYETSSKHCLLTNEYDFPDFPLFPTTVKVNRERSQFYSRPDLTIHSYAYNLIADLPDACRYGITKKTRDPLANFEVFWAIFNENYAYFKERNVDWLGAYDENLWRVEQLGETKEDQLALFEIFSSMIMQLDRDGHAGIEYIDSDDPSTTIVRDAASYREFGERLRSEFSKAYSENELRALFESYSDYFDDFGAFKEYMLINVFFANLSRKDAEIVKSYMTQKSLQEAANGQINWGVMEGNIGYIQILSMGGFSTDSEASVEEFLASLEIEMSHIVNEFRDTDSVILDVRLNGGGLDLIGLEIAKYFYDRPRTVFRKKARSEDRDANKVNIRIKPAPISYIKPIYLLTSSVTASAAEIFTLAMKELPYVRLVGEPTNGIFSDVLVKTLPNGWTVDVSNEIYADHQGISYEYVGVVPDETALMFDKAYRGAGKDSALERVSQLVGQADGVSCEYRVNHTWPNHFLAKVRVINVSSEPIFGWSVGMQFNEDAEINLFWNANINGDASEFSAKNKPWNSQIKPGGSVTFGLIGSTLNGETPSPYLTGICNPDLSKVVVK